MQLFEGILTPIFFRCKNTNIFFRKMNTSKMFIHGQNGGKKSKVLLT